MNTSIRIKIYTAISCLMSTAALSTAFSTTVVAQDVPHKTVKFNDLDITTPEGAKVLYKRITAAAREVCDVSIGSDPILRAGAKVCIDQAVDNAVRGVNAPMLTSLRFGSSDVRLASK
jgi:UrcA family protein